jgi:hypothetical protein
MIELSSLPAGRRRIADGTSGLPLEKVNRYREMWGMDPLASLPPGVKVRSRNGVPARLSSRKTAENIIVSVGPGTELKSIFKSNGVPSCQSCSSLALQMDQWGSDECEKRIDDIVEDMLPRAKGWVKDNRKFIHSLIPDAIESSAIRFKLRGYVKQAIRGARDKASLVAQSKTWEYGVTTVIERIGDLLPRTLASLSAAGFDKPRLFVDGQEDGSRYEKFGLPVTTRYPKVRTAGNWILSLWELYLRNPKADRYAIFQDDFVTYRNLRSYLNLCEYPSKGYWNLLSFMQNESIVNESKGWVPAKKLTGRGAVALVFDKDAVQVLLSSPHMSKRAENPSRGHKVIDGAIVQAFHNMEWNEYIHSPSLVQHTGLESSMGNSRHPLAKSYRGEDFDAMDFIDGQGHGTVRAAGNST